MRAFIRACWNSPPPALPRPSQLSDNLCPFLLKLAILKVLVSEPCTRPCAQLRGHHADQRVGPFAFKEGLARYNVHAALATREHDVGSARASQETEPFGADHGDDDDVVFVACFRAF